VSDAVVSTNDGLSKMKEMGKEVGAEAGENEILWHIEKALQAEAAKHCRQQRRYRKR